MFQACESSRLLLYSAKHLDLTSKLPGTDLLANVEWVKGDTEANKKIGAFTPRANERGDVSAILELLDKDIFVDNIIILHGGEEDGKELRSLVKDIREKINPDMLFSRVNICAKPDIHELAGELEDTEHSANEDEDMNDDQDKEENNPNNMEISGFSDSVLQLLMIRGAGGQLAR